MIGAANQVVRALGGIGGVLGVIVLILVGGLLIPYTGDDPEHAHGRRQPREPPHAARRGREKAAPARVRGRRRPRRGRSNTQAVSMFRGLRRAYSGFQRFRGKGNA